MFNLSYRWHLAVAILFASSTVTASNPAEGMNDNPSARVQFAMDPFDQGIEYSFARGDVKERVLQRFGKPVEETVSEVETRWPGQTETDYRLQFTDVAFSLGEDSDGSRSWIYQVEITGNAHRLKFGVQVGSSRAQIASLFTPSEHYAAANPMLVSVPTMETQRDFEESAKAPEGWVPTFDIYFEFDDEDRLTKITIHPTIDE